jgi:hypothetical protein
MTTASIETSGFLSKSKEFVQRHPKVIAAAIGILVLATAGCSQSEVNEESPNKATTSTPTPETTQVNANPEEVPTTSSINEAVEIIKTNEFIPPVSNYLLEALENPSVAAENGMCSDELLINAELNENNAKLLNDQNLEYPSSISESFAVVERALAADQFIQELPCSTGKKYLPPSLVVGYVADFQANKSTWSFTPGADADVLRFFKVCDDNPQKLNNYFAYFEDTWGYVVLNDGRNEPYRNANIELINKMQERNEPICN